MRNKKLEEMEQNWKRALADYQNLVKRTQEQQGLMRNFACINLIEKLLPAMDHLELAATHLKDPGLTMVVDQFSKILVEEGVSSLVPENQEFNPATMECVEMVEGKPGLVMEVVAKGYLMQNKVLRPAKVKVGKKETL